MFKKAASSSTQLSRTAPISQRCRYCGRSIKKGLQILCGATARIIKRSWRGEVNEEKKIVLRRSLTNALLQCLIHLLPICVTITLGYFNLAGYFIGSDLQGLYSPVYQALDILCLQVVAKLQELLVVASLGTILLDILRNQLLFRSEGLPLGILSAKQQFTEPKYLFSPEFRFGLAGFARHRQRLIFGILIVTISLVSLFAGPSAALLAIPTQRNDWPAGGASFWLVGNEDSLWPSKLTASNIGGAHCANPSIQMLETSALNSSGCVWAGFSPLAEAFKQSHLSIPLDVIIDDGVLRRESLVRPRGEVAETWVLASHVATGVLARNVAQYWYTTLVEIPASSSHHNLRYRFNNVTLGSVHSWVPAVRTRCETTTVFANASGELFKVGYPCLGRPFVLHTLMSVKYPHLPEYTVRLDLDYLIETFFTNSNRISTGWIKVPETAQLSDNSTTTDLPSGLLGVLTPFGDFSDTATLFTCSIDARWALGKNLGSPVGDLDAEYVQRAEILRTRSFAPDLPGFQYNFLPIKDGSWRRLQIDMDWLNTLMPPLGNSSTPGWTSLAALFTDMGLDNSTGMIFDWSDVGSPLESAIATVVADGMSRLGYSPNGGSLTHFSDSLVQLPWNNSLSSQRGMLAGSYQFPAPVSGPATQLHWSVVVSGYAYRADSVAYYLALSVLFLHAAMALCHVFYMLWKKVCCSAWGSLIGLVVLAARSGTSQVVNNPADVLENASSGIERYRTMSTKVRIRTQPAPLSPTTNQALQGNIKMLFGEETQAAGYEDCRLIICTGKARCSG